VAVTSNDIANQAIQIVGANQPPVTGQAPSFDNSAAGQALQKWYAPVVATVARQFGWDFARKTVTLSTTGNTPPFPWSYEYNYPGTIELWQVIPGSLADPNNPVPITWNVGNAVVSGAVQRVVWTNLASALGVYNNNPPEGAWDALFRETVVRLLGSVLGAAIEGKPETAAMLLQSSGAFESIGEARDN
jgi:hypothetical protein